MLRKKLWRALRHCLYLAGGWRATSARLRFACRRNRHRHSLHPSCGMCFFGEYCQVLYVSVALMMRLLKHSYRHNIWVTVLRERQSAYFTRFNSTCWVDKRIIPSYNTLGVCFRISVRHPCIASTATFRYL